MPMYKCIHEQVHVQLVEYVHLLGTVRVMMITDKASHMQFMGDDLYNYVTRLQHLDLSSFFSTSSIMIKYVLSLLLP